MKRELFSTLGCVFTGALIAIWAPGCGLGTQVCQPNTRTTDCDDIDLRVQQVMQDHCVQCHSDPPTAGAPGGFRLDVYEGNNGTQSRMARVLARSLDGTMPPPGLPALDEADLETLRSWDACQCNEQLSCQGEDECLPQGRIDVCVPPASGAVAGSMSCAEDEDCERGYSCVDPHGQGLTCLKRCDPDV
ncbi:MAG: hypothetical protein VYE40_12060 [Myxococcota bacterium]|nr:hypothetical protein [Myxococcota bacterium]MEC9441832.1 hypothetical protein [Myxococcota bacterium]